jgi:hypothetical protein
MRTRLFFLIIAVPLALCAFLVPGSWSPFAGRLTVTSPFPERNAVLGPDLPIPLISQYQGLATDNVNCGPAAVAAIVRYVRPDIADMDTASLVATARDHTGEPSGDTYLPGLARALNAFGVPSALLYAGDAGSDGADPLAPVQAVLAQGWPVIVTVDGGALGRGPEYGDHFVVVIGMNPQASLVDVVDPDTQTPQGATWMPGGTQEWPASLVRTAMKAAWERNALGVVAGARRTGVIPPMLLFLPPAVLLALLSMLPPRPGNRGKRTA